MNRLFLVTLCLIVIFTATCRRQYEARQSAEPLRSSLQPLPANASPQLKQFLEGAIDQTKVTTGYDAAYVGIKYPGGDVPPETGVCSDVIVRAFRKVGIDLQQEVHEDMKTAWSAYPRKWGAASPDTNIDHRRVLNLMTYFDRSGKTLPVTTDRKDYLPGDTVAWDLSGGMDHWHRYESFVGIGTALVDSSITSARARERKMCCSPGQSKDIPGTSVRLSFRITNTFVDLTSCSTSLCAFIVSQPD